MDFQKIAKYKLDSNRKGEVPMEWLKIIFLSLAMILIGYLVLRVIAKRNIGEMSIFNLFLVLMLANILSEPIRTDNTAELIIPTLVILGVYFIHSYLLTTNRIGKKLKNESVVLIRHGNIDENGLDKAKMTISEMLAELRFNGVSHVKDVEFAILEETGKISVIPTASKRPVSTGDLQVVTGYEGLPVELIIDGKIQYENLAKIELSREQLINRLGMQGFAENMIKTISLAVLDEKNNIIIDQNDDINQGNFNEQEQSLTKKIKEDLKISLKEPEDQELGIVDDYIKPKS